MKGLGRYVVVNNVVVPFFITVKRWQWGEKNIEKIIAKKKSLLFPSTPHNIHQPYIHLYPFLYLSSISVMLHLNPPFHPYIRTQHPHNIHPLYIHLFPSFNCSSYVSSILSSLPLHPNSTPPFFNTLHPPYPSFYLSSLILICSIYILRLTLTSTLSTLLSTP